MTSKQVKNPVRDSVEQGFDSLHRFADAVTFLLAPLNGAIHSIVRGVLNWLTDTHPEDRTDKKRCPSGKGPEPQQYNCGGEVGSVAVEYGYPARIDSNRRAFNFQGNEICDNKGDVTGFNNFGNGFNGGPNSGNSYFGFENNKIKGNGGKAEGFKDFGNDY